MTSGVGISLATHSGLRSVELARLAAEAERRGFAAVFLAEGRSDVLAMCSPVAAATSTVTVGTAIANAYLRPPVLTAMTAATLDDVSGGRFVLGLGTANAAYNHGVLGLPEHRPLRMMEEYVGLIRATLAGQPYAGELFRAGDALVLDRPPVRADLPIHLAALRPAMLELAGRIADGVILNLMSPNQVAAAVTTVRAAAAEAGRDPSAVTISCVVQTCICDDAAAADAAARGVIERYSRHPSAAKLFAEHDPDEAAKAVVISGSAGECRARLDEFAATGIDLPVVFPMPVGGSWQGVSEAAIEAFG